MNFNGPEWILIGDTDVDPLTTQQIQVAKDMKLNLKGAILCNDKDQQKNQICSTVPAFPTFCSNKTNVCYSGFRETRDHFEDLQKQSDAKPK